MVKKDIPFVLLAVLLVSCAMAGQNSRAETGQITRSSQPARKPTPADAFAFQQSARLGRGVNLGNALEAPQEGEWGVTLEESFFQMIKEGGFNSIRVPIRWTVHSNEKAPYTITPAFFARIDWVINQALKRKLVAVINMHNFPELIDSPSANRERFIALWGQIARHYQDYSDGLYFELLNEPNGNLTDTNAWNEILGAAIKEIRKTNPNRIIVVGPGNWYRVDRLSDLQLPPDDRNLIVTFHYYEPFHFTHQNAEWVDGSNNWSGTTWTATVNEKQAVDHDFDVALLWSKQNSRPIYLGEFGAYSKAEMDSRHTWTAYIARAAEARGFSWAYWEFCAGFGVYDRTEQTWVEPIYQALIP